MKRKIYYKDAQGIKVCGILSNPSSNNKKPMMILCHGFSTSKASQTYLRLEKDLNKFSISTLRFDFFGHGESEGKFEEITVSIAVDEILKAILFLKNQGYKTIGLFGSSFGGIASIMAAAKSEDLSLLVLKSPVSDYTEQKIKKMGEKGIEEWKDKGYTYYLSGNGRKLKLNYTFFEDFKNNNTFTAARKIKIPTLIVHGDNDESVPIEQSKRIADLINNCKLVVIKGADHYYSEPIHFNKSINLFTEFIKNNF